MAAVNPKQKRTLVGNDIVRQTNIRAQQTVKSAHPRPRTFEDVMRPKKMRQPVHDTPKVNKPSPLTHARPDHETIAAYIPMAQEKTDSKSKKLKRKPIKDAEDPFIMSVSLDLFVIVLLGYIGFISHALVFALVLYLVAIIFLNVTVKRLLVSSLICLILVPVMELLGRNTLEKSYIYCFVFYITIACLKLLVGRYKTA